mgnify:CR=1 FL=1
MDRSYAKIKVTANGPYEVSKTSGCMQLSLTRRGLRKNMFRDRSLLPMKIRCIFAAAGVRGMRLFVTAVTKRRIGTERKQLLLSRY